MIRILVLLCFCLTWPVDAQDLVSGGDAAGGGFDAALLAKVQTEAIEFILPRTVEVVSAAQLALWGLGGLTTLDPNLTAAAREGSVRLLVRGRTAFETPVSGTTVAAWGQAVSRVVGAGFAASDPLRQAGTAVVTKALFDQMLTHLDPYSRYVPPIEAMSDRDRRIGHAGIGVTLTQHGRYAVVRDVVIGSPAAAAGLVPGDMIQWVDGRTAIGRDPETVSGMLNGPEGTDVRMGWLGKDGGTHGATLTRVLIPPETVFPKRNGDILIVQITGFSKTTDQHVSLVVREAMRGSRSITGIVLDLRGNRGGLLRAAVATADLFLSSGAVVRSAGRAPETNRVWMSADGELAKGLRMAVLVDGGTASAAEVLAAALADRGRAVVIGSSTFGKGVVQTIAPLPDGGELFLTWSQLLAPRGWPIQSLGVLPQICTSLGDDVLRRQIASLAAGTRGMLAVVRSHRGARTPMTLDQIVAIREHCPASDARETDLAVAQALIHNPVNYAAALLEPATGER